MAIFPLLFTFFSPHDKNYVVFFFCSGFVSLLTVNLPISSIYFYTFQSIRWIVSSFCYSPGDFHLGALCPPALWVDSSVGLSQRACVQLTSWATCYRHPRNSFVPYSAGSLIFCILYLFLSWFNRFFFVAVYLHSSGSKKQFVSHEF